jgi:hypothetical protein
MRLEFLLPLLYFGLALYVWIDFIRLPPDGLANVGLMIVTLPVTLVGLLLTWMFGKTGFTLLPDALAYYGDHAHYYWPSVALIAGALCWLCATLSPSR